jgi:hypothetical protein
MMTTDDLIAEALTHLEHAATLAERAPDTDAAALAAQIRLAAATLPDPGTSQPSAVVTAGSVDVALELELALACLDEIAPLQGPPDLQLSAWHVHELHRLASTSSPS